MEDDRNQPRDAITHLGSYVFGIIRRIGPTTFLGMLQVHETRNVWKHLFQCVYHSAVSIIDPPNKCIGQLNAHNVLEILLETVQDQDPCGFLLLTHST